MTRTLLVLSGVLFLVACPGGTDDSGKTATVAEVCDNTVDDDGDTYVDCVDPDCYTAAVCVRTETDCTNGADDDGDKRQDCDDPDCGGDPACEGQETDCGNEADDDGDGDIDCADSDCADDPDCRT